MHVTSCISSTLVILNSVFKRWMDFFPVRSSLFLGLYASVYSCLISSIADQSVYPPKNNIHKILEKLYRNTKIWWSLSKISFTLHSWPSFRRRGGGILIYLCVPVYLPVRNNFLTHFSRKLLLATCLKFQRHALWWDSFLSKFDINYYF